MAKKAAKKKPVKKVAAKGPIQTIYDAMGPVPIQTVYDAMGPVPIERVQVRSVFDKKPAKASHKAAPKKAKRKH